MRISSAARSTKHAQATQRLQVELQKLTFGGRRLTLARAALEATLDLRLSLLDESASLCELRLAAREHRRFLFDRATSGVKLLLLFASSLFARETVSPGLFELGQLLAQAPTSSASTECI